MSPPSSPEPPTPPISLLPFNPHYITTERRSQDLIECALTRALDVMILGSISEANRIVMTLYEHNALQFENDEDMLRGMCFAWSHSGLWPSFVFEPDTAKPEFKREDDEWFTRDDVDGVLGKWEGEEWESYLPRENGEGRGKGRSRYRDVAAVLAEFDGAISRNDKDELDRLINEHVVSEFEPLSSDSNAYMDKHYANDHGDSTKRKPLTNCRSIWPVLCTGIVAQKLNISPKAITAYVDHGISLLKHRFTHGRTRIFANKTIPEVVAHLDADSLYLQNAFLAQNPDPPASKFPAWKVYTTYTSSPASEETISTLETRLDVTLPEDYKTFLRHTAYFGEDPDDHEKGWVYGPEAIDYDDWAQEYPADVGDFMLLPNQYLSIGMMDRMTWPPDLSAFSIGPGNDQGYVWMFGRKQIEAALEEFQREYATATEGEKRVYERAAKDLYGGLEEMRALEWLPVFWSGGNGASLPFGGFRAYLEYAAEEQILFRDMEDWEMEEKWKKKETQGEIGGGQSGKRKFEGEDSRNVSAKL